jgi:hypothetical protein
MNAKKIISILLLVAGIVVLILSAIADFFKIGENPSFGNTQIAGVLAGAIIAVVGWILFRKNR